LENYRRESESSGRQLGEPASVLKSLAANFAALTEDSPTPAANTPSSAAFWNLLAAYWNGPATSFSAAAANLNVLAAMFSPLAALLAAPSAKPFAPFPVARRPRKKRSPATSSLFPYFAPFARKNHKLLAERRLGAGLAASPRPKPVANRRSTLSPFNAACELSAFAPFARPFFCPKPKTMH